MRVSAWVGWVALLLVGCESWFPTVPDPQTAAPLTVLCLLHTGRDLQVLTLSRAVAYPRNASGGEVAEPPPPEFVRDATVTVIDLTDPTAEPVRFRYTDPDEFNRDPEIRRFAPSFTTSRPFWVAKQFQPRPRHRYRLEVATGAGKRLNAETGLPDTIRWTGTPWTRKLGETITGSWQEATATGYGAANYDWQLSALTIGWHRKVDDRYNPRESPVYDPVLDTLFLDREQSDYQFKVVKTAQTRASLPLDWTFLGPEFGTQFNFGPTTVSAVFGIEQLNTDLDFFLRTAGADGIDEELRNDRLDYTNVSGEGGTVGRGLFGGVTLTEFPVRLPSTYYVRPDVALPPESTWPILPYLQIGQGAVLLSNERVVH